jgi:hypothetical protein
VKVSAPWKNDRKKSHDAAMVRTWGHNMLCPYADRNCARFPLAVKPWLNEARQKQIPRCARDDIRLFCE